MSPSEGIDFDEATGVEGLLPLLCRCRHCLRADVPMPDLESVALPGVLGFDAG